MLAAPRRRRGPLRSPAPPASRSASSTSRPTCWPASRPTTCGPPSCGPSAPKPRSRGSTSTTSPRSGSAWPTPWRAGRRAARVGRITFRGLTAGLVERLEVVVRFLAVLELYKQGLVDLDQAPTLRRHQRRLGGGEADDGTRRTAGRPRRRRRLRRAEPPWTSRSPCPDETRPRPSRRSDGGRRAGRAPTCWPSCSRSPPTEVEELLRRAWPPATRPRAGASCWSGWPAATASRATPTWPPTSSASCSRASRPGCRPPPSRRWPSSPTSSRSPGPRWPPSAASTSTA